MTPNVIHSNARNAARLATFAEAAYFGHDRFAAERTLFEEENPDGNCTWWSYGNAAGVVYVDAERICIGLAGTDDKDDARNDYDFFNQTLGDWSSASDFAVAPGLADTSSTAGFLAYAALCYGGIETTLADLESDNRRVWIAGHSLGGAAAQILQCTLRYSGCRVYTYGSPRVFRGRVPEEIRVSVRRITDPVVYGPFGYYHPSSDTIWVRYPGSVRTQLPWKYKPIAAAYRAAVWSKGLVQAGLASLGVPVRPTLADGHSMTRYRADLWPLR